MSAELVARIADLEVLLEAAKREHQAVLRGVAMADAHLVTLRTYLQRATVREALRNVLPDVELAGHGDDALLWSHVVPAYKVDECTDLALRRLRGEW